MAERIVQEESLTTVADAIRAKGGTTDALPFPTGFADAIAAIQAGGGGGISAYVETVTFAENTLNYTVQHNLGSIPDAIAIVCTNKRSTSTNTFPNGIVYWYADQEKGTRVCNTMTSDSGAKVDCVDFAKVGFGKNSNGQLTATETTATLSVVTSAYGFAGGSTYKIVICKTA